MPSGVKDIQLLELKDTISQLNKTISTQNELISSLQKMLEERNAKDSEKDLLIANLQSQLAYLKNKVFGSTSEIRHDQLDGQLNLFGTPVGDEKPAEVIEPEVISVKGYTKERKPKATYDDKYNSVRSICKHFFTDIVGLSIKFFCVSLRHMSIGAGIIAAVPLQEIDNAPHAQASAESHNKGLQSINSGRKELHIASISPGVSPAMKKAAHTGGRLRPLDALSRSALYIGIRIVHIVVVEDVLVLAYGPRIRYVYLVHLTSLVQPRPPAAVNELVEGKGVFLFVGFRRVLVVGVLLQIVLLGIERGQAPELQNALIARHGSQLAGGHQLPAQPLGVLVVAFRLPTGAALGLHGDCGLSQPVFGNLLDGGAFPPAQENHAVHVA